MNFFQIRNATQVLTGAGQNLQMGPKNNYHTETQAKIPELLENVKNNLLSFSITIQTTIAITPIIAIIEE